MKNKKTLYILIPSVALIWGLIIWKVVSFKKDDVHALPPGQAMIVAAEVDTSRYQVNINYGDPFLRRARQMQATKSDQPSKRENRIKKVDVKSMTGPKRPENLVYRGVISCNEERIGLLEVGPQKRLIKEKSLIGDFQVISVEIDSLRILYHEKEYAYGKQ